ncbi:hypothetical protein BC567DRAFT_237153 [Phyllosticta citribraziliensis]
MEVQRRRRRVVLRHEIDDWNRGILVLGPEVDAVPFIGVDGGIGREDGVVPVLVARRSSVDGGEARSSVRRWRERIEVFPVRSTARLVVGANAIEFQPVSQPGRSAICWLRRKRGLDISHVFVLGRLIVGRC